MSDRSEENHLFPVFLKLDKIQTLVVGGGYVGWEKLGALLKNDEEAKVKIVAPKIREEVREIVASHPAIELLEKEYESYDLQGINLVIGATNFYEVNEQIYHDAKEKGILVNVADTPELCDFYLGSTVKKGNLKIGISTNGKSPTFAKRLRAILEEVLPEKTDNVLQNLSDIRKGLKGDFEKKLEVLNDITASFVHDKKEN
ncbi:bifunctional precorrin-2 dehydrogenase/sirohydrochlorin ferrochelatase [Marivirga sp.]|uniref:precorrin-2 dehydrogenase/sirohydrochlorin ferrochelatase family protein n=1 Tax=Marivirga sp. TaxID=2018662 RepID=UPI0025F65688|nr:bifunctional precorrin-2 dehydrogenase/sirohydrochlorin ferrochelatase [Marivirga sp.]